MELPQSPSWFARGLTNLLRLAFRLLYGEFAWTYDWVAATVSIGNWKSWVSTVIPYLRPGPLLEIGHGPGHLQSALLVTNEGIFGLDASQQMGRIAARRLREAGLKPRLCRSRTQGLPFPDCTFLTIVSTFPSEYIADPRSLTEIWHTLKPGGRLVVLPFAWITGNRLIERTAGWLFKVTRQSPGFPIPAETNGMGGPEAIHIKDYGPWFRNFGQTAEEIGFQLTGEILELENSALILVIAEKPVHP